MIVYFVSVQQYGLRHFSPRASQSMSLKVVVVDKRCQLTHTLVIYLKVLNMHTSSTYAVYKSHVRNNFY